MSLTRRDFVVGIGSAAALCAVGGVPALVGGNDDLLRPPGCQDEAAFIGACIKCDRCRSVCPQNCISLATVEDGLLKARSPKLDYHKGACTFCGKCQEVCPTGAVRSFDPAVERIGTAQLNPDRCVAWSSPGSCTKCMDACGYGAVSFDGGYPQVDVGKCNGCGFCEYVCPALSLRSLPEGEGRGIQVKPVSTAEGGEAA